MPPLPCLGLAVFCWVLMRVEIWQNSENFTRINHVIAGVALLDKTKPIKAGDAIAAIEHAHNPKQLSSHGGDRKGKIDQDYHDNLDRFENQGTLSEYLAARIARDHPDIHEAMKRGEYPSVRKAAIAAGVVKPRKTFSVADTTDPQDFAGQLFERLDREFLIQVVAILNEAIGGDRFSPLHRKIRKPDGKTRYAGPWGLRRFCLGSFRFSVMGVGNRPTPLLGSTR